MAEPHRRSTLFHKRVLLSLLVLAGYCFLALGSTDDSSSDSSSSAGDSSRDCAHSCQAWNDNNSGHDWVEPYGSGPGYREYEACLDEAVAARTTADALGCTERGNRACAQTCRKAGAGR